MKRAIPKPRRMPIRRPLFMALCAGMLAGFAAASAVAQETAAAIDAMAPRDADLVAGEVALCGVAGDAVADAPITPARPFTVRIALRWLPDVPAPFDRDLMVSLGGIDIARVPVTEPAPQPGGVAVVPLELYVPRSLPPGTASLAVGFAVPDAPGERMGLLAPRMAELAVVRVGKPPPVSPAPPDERATPPAGHPAPEDGNLLQNGSFERGFMEWQVDESLFREYSGWPRILDLAVTRDAAFHGEAALRIVFGGGQDPNFFHLRQRVAAAPNTRYRLSYYCRAEALTSNSAPVILAQDPEAVGQPFVAMPESAAALSGTTPWRRVEVEFVTPPDTEMLEVRVNRGGSGTGRYLPERFGPIGGAVWFDAVRLVEVEAS